MSAPAVVLAAIAARTSRIRLTSAVSVLSSDDPVRVFEEFATLDLLSGGRAEIMVGRGSFIESFPLFGYDLGDYDALFEEKLELLLALRESERVTWSGRYRAPLDGQGVYPRPVQDPLPVWVAVGGTPESALRAGRLGLPMALAIIGGEPERFRPFAELHREAAREAGHDPLPPLSINSHAYVAETTEQAGDEFFPAYAAMMNAIGRERRWSGIGRDEFDRLRSPRGALLVGSPSRWSRRSSSSTSCSAISAFWPRRASGRCRTTVLSARSSSSGWRSRPPSAPSWRAARPRTAGAPRPSRRRRSRRRRCRRGRARSRGRARGRGRRSSRCARPARG